METVRFAAQVSRHPLGGTGGVMGFMIALQSLGRSVRRVVGLLCLGLLSPQMYTGIDGSKIK